MPISPDRARAIAEMDAVKAIPPERVALARGVLVESAIALVIRPRLPQQVRQALVNKIRVAMPDLAGMADHPVSPVREAAWRVTEAYEKDDWQAQQDTEKDLRLVLFDLFLDRSEAAARRLAGADPDVIET